MNPMLLCDAYKLGHMEQYPEGTTLVYSNFTARNFKHMEKVYPIKKMVVSVIPTGLGKQEVPQ
jgi:nicotinic acid phosphoribosyltransferase